MAPDPESITLSTAARGITEAANTWLEAVVLGAALIGVVLLAAGILYLNKRQQDPRLSLAPCFAMGFCGCAMILGAYGWSSLKVTLYRTDALYLYASAGYQDWEAQMILATLAVLRLIGVAAYYWGWSTLAQVGLEGWPIGSGRLIKGSFAILAGFSLAEIGLLLTAILGTLGLPSPFSP